MSTKKYGKTDEEIVALDTFTDRQIVQEILKYGVSQTQIMHIAYLLSLELENGEALRDISMCIKKYLDLDFGDTESTIFGEDPPQDSGIITK